tara:strand:- start:31 stop:273 length:243 start_codon:yes stop_codon:yes gene_type:complete
VSNEYEVHNFYNHSIGELRVLKIEHDYLCDHAIKFKEGMADLDGSLTKQQWYEKHDGESPCDDDMLFDEAEEFFEGEEEL